MKKITLLFLLIGATGFAQQKSTGDIVLSAAQNISANFTLDNATSKVTLVLKGPSDRWFALGMGPNVVSGFGMSAGDVLVYTTSLTDRRFVGTGSPTTDTTQDWAVISNTTTGATRTLILERNLTNTDTAGSDLQLPYATTTTINLACAFPNSATTSLAGGHGRAFASGTFSLLGTQDFSLNATEVYPNPSNGNFTVKTKTGLDKINVYSQVGQFVKTINVNKLTAAEVNLEDLSSGVYLIELQNATDKSWKKIIVN